MRDELALSSGSPNTAGAGPTARLDVVDGLRGVAILMVLFRHSFFDTYASPGYGAFFVGDGTAIFPFTYLSNTWMGVNLFFVDSGFVLFLPFAKETRAIRAFSDVVEIYVRRAWRLFPLYYSMLVVYVIVDLTVLHNVKSFWFELSTCLTFTFPFFRETWQPRLNGALWSIGVEVCFSVVFPLLVLLVQRIGLTRFVALATFVSVGTRYLAYAHHLGVQNTPTLNTLGDSLLGRIDNFALGMAAAAMYARGWRGVRPSVALGAAICLFTMSCWLWDTSLALKEPGLAAPIAGAVLSNVAFFLLLIAALGSQGALQRFLRLPALRAAGIGCYSLYLVHVPVLWLWGGHPVGAQLFAYWALVAALSFLTYRLIEKPAMVYGRARARRTSDST